MRPQITDVFMAGQGHMARKITISLTWWAIMTVRAPDATEARRLAEKQLARYNVI